jgi:catechol 2,3-dioxygenase
VRWDAASLSTNARWGLPALEKWYFEATVFEGTAPKAPDVPQNPMTLERFLLEQRPI